MKVLIRGLEAGSAYLAYLLRESGVYVEIQTASLQDPVLDVPPFEPVFTLDFLKEVLGVVFVEKPTGSYDAVVDSCDIFNLGELKKAFEKKKPIYVIGDAWLSASISLYHGLPVPDVDIDLPVEKTESFEEVNIKYRLYVGGNYAICGSFRDGWGDCLYTPMRAFERIFTAVDIYSALTGLEPPKRKLKLEYAVGRDIAYVTIGCRPEGKASKINLERTSVWLYSEGGRPSYVYIQTPVDDLQWAFAMYNLARYTDSAFLFDMGVAGRGPLNIAYLGHLFREKRKSL
jgi:hypothetical protein